MYKFIRNRPLKRRVERKVLHHGEFIKPINGDAKMSEHTVAVLLNIYDLRTSQNSCLFPNSKSERGIESLKQINNILGSTQPRNQYSLKFEYDVKIKQGQEKVTFRATNTQKC
ncbi:hypothetical protein RF11_09100 [Thelohanellus kitauei]|uniref:Uncharacterized protein n=1 Tax=Thelohanellus kitauei TaxID=669202 RepID=A0A0C2J6F9_THEKT|nr:hypothetical protein RF11_09100 [Thelohanellus kitauei]